MNKENKSISKSPWGKYEVLLNDANCKVKKITVKPKTRLSYQSHKKRAEVWVVISGEGLLTQEEKTTPVKHAAIVMIPYESKHRIENTHETEDLVFIETQIGTYFGEDDITRYEDDYGRHLDNWVDCDADLL
jgi:mannose-6-phosphate isomerase-like protein (cupin superfamily)